MVCVKDLTNRYYINDDRELQYDHILPLEKGGINDPTNFQLLCQECNLDKNIEIEDSKDYYQFFWR